MLPARRLHLYLWMAEGDVRCAVPKRGALLAKDRSSVAALRRMLVLIPPLSYADGVRFRVKLNELPTVQCCCFFVVLIHLVR